MKRKIDDADSTARLESFVWHKPIDCRVGKICYCSRSRLASAWKVLKQYRENRENGGQNLNPPYPFPSSGFDRLEVLSSETPDEGKWPDKQGRFWWKLKLRDGSSCNDFYWMWSDGNPDGMPGSGPGPYSFIVYGPESIRIEGFSWERDNEKEPDQNGNYWWYTKYTECDAIKEWMEQKDKNYQIELEQKKEEEDNDGKKSSSFSSRLVFWQQMAQQPLPQRSQSKQFGYYLHVTSESRNKEMVYHFNMQGLRESLDDSKKEELRQITENIYNKEYSGCGRGNIIEITLKRENAQILLDKLQEILSFDDNLLPGEALSPRPGF